MSLITVNGITINGPTSPLIADGSFSINVGDRIGLVGNNGSGKSTLLKYLVGEEPVSGGKISRQKGMRIGYIEQSVPPEFEDLTLYEVIEDAIPEEERSWSQYKVELALEALGASEDIQLKTMRELSGGWRRLALIARTNLDDPDLLLLDEPTNHLDIGKVLRLEKWLRDTVQVPYLIVSHDRRFLDETTNKTFFMRGGEIRTFKQPYSRAVEILTGEDQAAAVRRGQQQAKIDQLSATARRFKQQAQGHGSERLARTAMTMESRIEQLEDALEEVYSEDTRAIQLAERELDSTKPIIKIEDLTVKTPDGRELFHIDYLDIKRGERLAVLGLNGSGKSMLMCLIMSEYERFKANPRAFDPRGITFNDKTEIGFVDQELSALPVDKSLIDFVRDQFILNETRAIAVLAKAGFRIEQQNVKVGKLSYGERVRLAFAALRVQQPNAFILDEPTNHLDIDGQHRLVDTVLRLDAPCFVVSHDRQFLDEVATRFVVITNGHLEPLESPDTFYEIAYDFVSVTGTALDLTGGKKKSNVENSSPVLVLGISKQ